MSTTHEKLIRQGLRPDCVLTVRYGTNGRQLARLLWEIRGGNSLKVIKFLANSRRWTKPTVIPVTDVICVGHPD